MNNDPTSYWLAGVLALTVLINFPAHAKQTSISPASVEKADSTVDCQGINSIRNLGRRISATISKRERNSVRRCATIGVGARPCGGPERYLVYSRSTTDVERLKALVRRYNQCDRIRNRKHGNGGGCLVELRPDVRLKRGHCMRR